MTKTELSKLLHSVTGVQLVSEDEGSIDSPGKYPRIVYWETAWTDHNASGDDYGTTVTYQVSFCDRKPRSKSLLDLKRKLNAAGIHPVFYHENVIPTDGRTPHYQHSYCAVDVEEDLLDE